MAKENDDGFEFAAGTNKRLILPRLGRWIPRRLWTLDKVMRSVKMLRMNLPIVIFVNRELCGKQLIQVKQSCVSERDRDVSFDRGVMAVGRWWKIEDPKPMC
jgi:hypothetical protein